MFCEGTAEGLSQMDIIKPALVDQEPWKQRNKKGS